MATTISRNLNSDIYNYIINDTAQLNERHKLVLPAILQKHSFSSKSLHTNPHLKRIAIQRNNSSHNLHKQPPAAEHKLRINQISMIVNKRNHNVLKDLAGNTSRNRIATNAAPHNKKVYPSIYKQLQTYRKHNVVHSSSANCYQQQLPQFNMQVFNYSYGASPCVGFKIKDYNGIKINSSSV